MYVIETLGVLDGSRKYYNGKHGQLIQWQKREHNVFINVDSR